MSILPELASIEEEIIQTYKDDITNKRTFQFDFEKGEFITDVVGKPIMTSNSSELLEQIVQKILHDRRYKNLIYPSDYGNEIQDILEEDEEFEIMSQELFSIYEEALVYHPFIDSISDFTVEQEEDKLICTFIVSGIDGVSVNIKEELNYGNDRL